jgi:hypothetical protein
MRTIFFEQSLIFSEVVGLRKKICFILGWPAHDFLRSSAIG